MSDATGDKLSPTDLIALAKQAGMIESVNSPIMLLCGLSTLQAFADLIRKEVSAVPDGSVISGYSIPISAKRFANEIQVQRSRQIEGPPLWAVRLNGDCLNKSGEWEWEPMPSSRDDEFLERCRFSSHTEAIEAAIRVRGTT